MRRRRVQIAIAIALVLAAGIAALALSRARKPAGELPVLAFRSDSPVVAVEATEAPHAIHPFIGTGVVVAQDGGVAYVATAKHLVEDGGSWVSVVLPTSDDTNGRSAETGEVYLDPEADLAIVKVRLPDEMWLHIVPSGIQEGIPDGAYLGEYDCVRGPDFAFLAYPFRIDPQYRFYDPSQQDETFVHTDAMPLPGCSGGPVFAWTAGKDPGIVGIVNYAVQGGLGFVNGSEIRRFLDLVRSGAVAPVGGSS